MRYKALNKKMMYHRVFKKGHIIKTTQKPLKNPSLLLRFVLSPHSNDIRVGFLIRKKTGKAFFRNKLRRILKSCLQDHSYVLPHASWLLFDIPPKTLELSLKQFRLEVKHLLLQLSQTHFFVC